MVFNPFSYRNSFNIEYKNTRIIEIKRREKIYSHNFDSFIYAKKNYINILINKTFRFHKLSLKRD